MLNLVLEDRNVLAANVFAFSLVRLFDFDPCRLVRQVNQLSG
jgi:hypothetical protein